MLRSTCPNHLILLVRSTTSKSWIPSFVRRESELTSFFALTLQIQRIMARSLRRRRFSVSTFMAKVSAACSITLLTHDEYTLPLVRRGRWRLMRRGSHTDPHIFYKVDLWVTLIHFPKYNISQSKSLQDVKQNPIKYRSLTYIYLIRSIYASHWFIDQIILKISSKVTRPWNIGHIDLHLLWGQSLGHTVSLPENMTLMHQIVFKI